ncbi:MAG: GNAT family N-acetyltransferase [Candidatus Nanogingivalaceae bacterium]|nr:GNAT family N-acetyltransferase [Candidatus Nanogingivalaceae bacterium]MBF1024974.1 GNAT family N-acetyltransferase [Candidatus Nanogingivalaceae bacterium]
MAEVITTAPKSKEAEVKLLIMPLGELTSHLGDDKASTAIEAIAKLVNRRKPGDKQMLPVSYADITGKYTDIVALRLPETPSQEPKDAIDTNSIINSIVGYVGAMGPIKHGARPMSEVGSLKVDDSLRGHGVGTILFERIIKAMQDEGITPYAFCNSDSLPIAKRLGGREIESADEVPPEALELCQECPLYGQGSKKHGCCDTVMVWDKTQNADG